MAQTGASVGSRIRGRSGPPETAGSAPPLPRRPSAVLRLRPLQFPGELGEGPLERDSSDCGREG